MGFLDKAKKLAEQAQTKLDEVQSQVNQEGSPRQPTDPIVEYDQHGRPIAPQQSTTPPHGDPLAGSAPPPPGESVGPPPAPGVPPTEPPSGPPPPVEGATMPPPAPGMPGSHEEDRNRTDYTPPKLTGGDPLAG